MQPAFTLETLLNTLIDELLDTGMSREQAYQVAADRLDDIVRNSSVLDLLMQAEMDLAEQAA